MFSSKFCLFGALLLKIQHLCIKDTDGQPLSVLSLILFLCCNFRNKTTWYKLLCPFPSDLWLDFESNMRKLSKYVARCHVLLWHHNWARRKEVLFWKKRVILTSTLLSWKSLCSCSNRSGFFNIGKTERKACLVWQASKNNFRNKVFFLSDSFQFCGFMDLFWSCCKRSLQRKPYIWDGFSAFYSYWFCLVSWGVVNALFINRFNSNCSLFFSQDLWRRTRPDFVAVLSVQPSPCCSWCLVSNNRYVLSNTMFLNAKGK